MTNCTKNPHKKNRRRKEMTNSSKPRRSPQSPDEELVAMLRYLRLGRLLGRWDETLEEARQERYSSQRLFRQVVAGVQSPSQAGERTAAPPAAGQHPQNAGDGNLPFPETTEAQPAAGDVALR